jgi:26S proteasome regulatory subunit N8
VSIHPIVLLSIVDHFNRANENSKRRVVGILLGEMNKGVLDVTNCYAIPFDEDPKEAGVWYADHVFHE